MATRSGVLLIAGVLLAVPAHAQKTYTPEQLRQMIQSGNEPKEGYTKTERLNMSFYDCKVKVQRMNVDVQPNYPTRPIAFDDEIVKIKMWTNDAAMTLTCIKAEGVLVIQTAIYL